MYKKILTTFVSIVFIAACGAETRVQGQEMQAPLTFIVLIDVSGSMDDKFPAPVQPILTDSTKLMDVKRRLSLLVQHLPENTRVLVTVFDHEAKQLCDLRLDSLAARLELEKTFATVKSRNGSTHLWRTADAELARAKQIAESSPENRVRVLLYSDGNDMENAPGLDHSNIIRKYGKSLQSTVRLDWITIGFDVQADIKRELQANGVIFTRADQPSEIEPLIAAFKLSQDSILVGDEVLFIPQSIGIKIQQHWVDWGDGSQPEQGESLRHRYTKAGRFKVRYIVINASGRRSEASSQLLVTKPSAPLARFRLPAASVQRGEAFSPINESGDSSVRFEWKVDERTVSDQRQPSLAIDTFGPHQITLTVWDRSSQSSSTDLPVNVTRPAAPVAIIIMHPTATLGEKVHLVSASTGLIDSPLRWFVDGNVVGEGPVLYWSPGNSGKHTVRLHVSGPGGEHTAEKELLVQPFESPKASFLVGNDRPFVGDTIKVSDASSGKIDRIEFEVLGLDEPIRHKIEVRSDDRWFELNCRKAGEITVHQSVFGPGGTDQVTRTFQVTSRSMQPSADFKVLYTKSAGRTVARFVNQTQGSAERFEFDPGDGGSVREFEDASAIEHVYSSGTWVPTITAYGAAQENFSPSTWVGQEIVVVKPLSPAVKNLLWQIPLGLMVLAGLVIIPRKIREHRVRQHQNCIGGHLTVYSRNKPREPMDFDFAATSLVETVTLDDATTLRLASTCEGPGRFECELQRQGSLPELVNFDESGQATVGEYVVSYTA